jgi:hypothetical protein
MAIKYYQVPLPEHRMERLKRYIGEETNLGALTALVNLYLEQVHLYEKLKRLSGEKTLKGALTAAIKFYIEQHEK